MKPLFRNVISLGIGALIDYLSTSKPLRKLLRKKAPSLDQKRIDELANEGLQKGEDLARKVIK